MIVTFVPIDIWDLDTEYAAFSDQPKMGRFLVSMEDFPCSITFE